MTESVMRPCAGAQARPRTVVGLFALSKKTTLFLAGPGTRSSTHRELRVFGPGQRPKMSLPSRAFLDRGLPWHLRQGPRRASRVEREHAVSWGRVMGRTRMAGVGVSGQCGEAHFPPTYRAAPHPTRPHRLLCPAHCVPRRLSHALCSPAARLLVFQPVVYHTEAAANLPRERRARLPACCVLAARCCASHGSAVLAVSSPCLLVPIGAFRIALAKSVLRSLVVVPHGHVVGISNALIKFLKN